MRRTLLAVACALTVACHTSGLGSIGAVLGRDNDTHAVYVREAPLGLAAEQAGLLPGDEIVMIDGAYVHDLGPKDLRARLRGDVGSTVELTVLRGSVVRRVKVTRTELRPGDEPRPREEKLSE